MRLSLEDAGFTTGMAKAAAATALLDRSLGDLDGSQVGTSESAEKATRSTKEYTLAMAVAEEKSSRLRKSLRDQAKASLDLESGIDRSGDAFRKSGADIDKFSGRLRLIADAVAVLGPGLVPIAAIGVPAIAGLAAQMGILAGGAGATVLAMQGLGDAMDALNKAQLEPTRDNLKAAREAMDLLSPSAQRFAVELDRMRPALAGVREAGAEALFPRLGESLDELADVLPKAEQLMASFGRAVGSVAQLTADSLAGGEWDEFIDFLSAEALPTMTAMGRTAGSLAKGMAELWMAFDPLNDDFTNWLEGVAQGFEDWATGLDQTEGFQEFVDYIRATGPQVADTFSAMANAILQIAEAAAPLGGPVLSALEGIFSVIARIADSPLGPVIMAAVTAMSALNLGSTAITKLGSAFTGATTGVGKFQQGLAKATTALIALEAAGQVIDMLGKAAAGAAPDVEDLAAALISVDSAAFNEELGGSLQELIGMLDTGFMEDFGNALNDLGEKGGGVGTALVTGLGQMAGLGPVLFNARADSEKLEQALTSLDAALVSIVATGGADRAEEAFAALAASQGLTEEETSALLAQLPQYDAALKGAANSAALAAEGGHGLGEVFQYIADGADGVYEAADSLDAAALSALSLERALDQLSGRLDKRDALRGYGDAIKALTKDLKDGFGKDTAANVDAIGRSVETFFANVSNKSARESFIDQTISDLEGLAANAGPKARKEINALLADLRDVDAANVDPHIDIDDVKAKNKVKAINKLLREVDASGAEPKIDADTKAAMAKLGMVLAEIGGIPQYIPIKIAVTINRTIKSVADEINSGLGNLGLGSADGSTVPKTGKPYADRHLYMLADGEEIISNRRGQADRYRPLLKAINNAADGTTIGTHARSGTSTPSMDASGLFTATAHAISGLYSLGELALQDAKDRRREARLDLRDAEKKRDSLREDLDAQRAFRDGILDLRDSLAGSFATKGALDIFREGSTLESAIADAKSNTGNAQELEAAVDRLTAAGMGTAALNALFAQGGAEEVIRFSQYAAADLQRLGNLVAFSIGAQNQSGMAAGQAVFGAQLSSAGAAEGAALAAYREQAQATRDLQKSFDAATKELEQVKDHLQKIKDESPKKTGDAVGTAINRASGAAARRRAVA